MYILYIKIKKKNCVYKERNEKIKLRYFQNAKTD